MPATLGLDFEFWYFLGIWSLGFGNFATKATLVPEMSHPGENHRHLALIGSCDYLFVTH